MPTRLLLVFLRLSLCYAAFWPWQIQITNTASNPIVNGLTEDELVGLLASHAALENYSRQPDCFRRAAANIRLRCGELDMHADERVRAAISMTLCELATATHHSLPLECVSFTVDSDASSAQIQGECVDALSRSAQFWSSYSGYLREVPQLCFAFRRWNDIDTAKDIYKNSITEMSTLARLLLAREKADAERRKRWDSQVSELEDVATRLKTVPELIDTVITAATPRLQNEMTAILNAFKAELAHTQINTRAENSRLINQIDSELQIVSQSHARSLDGLVPFLAKSLADDLDVVLSPFRTQSLVALDVANSAHNGWINLTVQVTAMQQKILELSGSVSDTATTLDASSKQAQVVHDSQISASLSASHLAETLAQLTTTTQDSLEKFNASAVQLAQSLSPRSGLFELIRFMEVALPIDPSTIAFLHHLPIFPAVSAVLSLLLYLLRSSLSALMSIAFLFFSFRKYIIKPGYNQQSDAAVNHATTVPSCQLHPSPHLTRIQSDPEIISRPRIRKSRIPDRLCNKH